MQKADKAAVQCNLKQICGCAPLFALSIKLCVCDILASTYIPPQVSVIYCLELLTLLCSLQLLMPRKRFGTWIKKWIICISR